MAQGQQQQQRGGRGGAPRNEQRAQAPARPPIDYAARAQDVMVKLAEHRPELETFLPSNISFEKFQGTLAIALRHNPGILECTTSSIIQACMKAAYDDLALDGREAALVPSNNKVKIEGRDVWRKEARYNPMVAGLRKQIVRGGQVDDLISVLVYEGEPYRVIRGTNPSIDHEEILSKRGPGKKIVAAYSMAWLKNGRVTFETMSKADLDAVRAMAATDYVWAKNEGEMCRKTVIRRHRKALPGCNDIRDAEAITMFPQFAEAGEGRGNALPAPPQPRRADFRRQAELGAPSVSIGDDFNDFGRRTDEVFDGETGEITGEGKPAAKKAEAQKSDSRKATDQTTDGNRPDAGAVANGQEEPVANKGDEAGAADKPAKMAYPETPEKWQEWADILVPGLDNLPNEKAVNLEYERQLPLIESAPAELARRVNDAFSERLADLATGPQPGLNLDNGGTK